MKSRFYKLPIKFDSVFHESAASMEVCSEIESIDQNIELLIKTCPGEHKFDKSFGCRIWEMDFERIVSRKKWEESFVSYISESISNFEKRLKEVAVNIDIMEVAREDHVMKTTAIKKRVEVNIRAVLVSSDEPCSFKYKLFLGPLSTEQ